MPGLGSMDRLYFSLSYLLSCRCFLSHLMGRIHSIHFWISLEKVDQYEVVYLADLGRWKEQAMAPPSSTLAWKIPWMEEPGRLQSMGSLTIGHYWVTSLFTFMHWRRKWQPTPVFLPRESQGWRSLVGCRLWDHTKSDTTEVT